MSNSHIRTLYNRAIRPHLPRKLGSYAGVTVRRPRILDRFSRVPEFKESMVNAVVDAVEAGDTVLEIGSGWGVVTTRAAWRVGSEGAVISYDASPDRTATARETVRRHAMQDRVDIRQAAVETLVVKRRNAGGGAPVVDVGELPEHDVTVLDCEGAEMEIVPALLEAQTTRAIIMETHENHGGSVQELEIMLDTAGYDVRDRGRVTPNTDSHGRRVLQATYSEEK